MEIFFVRFNVFVRLVMKSLKIIMSLKSGLFI